MILISDTGGTSSDWAFIEDDGQVLEFHFKGYNPVSQHPDEINELLEGVRRQLGNRSVSKVHFYGTGIISLEVEEMIQESISKNVSANEILVMTDLLGAVRATCDKAPGMVVIIGTGSNVCQFDGRKIESRTPSLGYPLGDEGSGVDIGKRMIRSYYYHELPTDIAADIASELPNDRSSFLVNLKNHKKPNQYLASFARIALNNLDHPFIKSLVRSSFKELFKHHISKYEKGNTIHFVGSVAYKCRPFIKQLVEEYGFVVGKFVRSPMEGLITYHKLNSSDVR